MTRSIELAVKAGNKPLADLSQPEKDNVYFNPAALNRLVNTPSSTRRSFLKRTSPSRISPQDHIILGGLSPIYLPDLYKPPLFQGISGFVSGGGIGASEAGIQVQQP